MYNHDYDPGHDYSDDVARDKGYDGPPAGAGADVYRCADGMCGAEDCDTCHPGCEPDYEEED